MRNGVPSPAFGNLFGTRDAALAAEMLLAGCNRYAIARRRESSTEEDKTTKGYEIIDGRIVRFIIA